MGFLISSSTICPVDRVTSFTIDSYFFQVSNVHLSNPNQTGVLVSVLTTVYSNICWGSVLQKVPQYCKTLPYPMLFIVLLDLIPSWPISDTLSQFLAGTFTYNCCSVGVEFIICLIRPMASSVRSGWNLTLFMELVARRGTRVRSWEGQALSFNTSVSFEAFVQSSGKTGWGVGGSVF